MASKRYGRPQNSQVTRHGALLGDDAAQLVHPERSQHVAHALGIAAADEVHRSAGKQPAVVLAADPMQHLLGAAEPQQRRLERR